MMVGERLREARQSRSMSLSDVAGKAGISASTLSRIETGKQGVELDLFLRIVEILDVQASEILDGSGSASEPIASRLLALTAQDRAKVWRQLAKGAKSRHAAGTLPPQQLNQAVEELLAQLDYVRSEIEAVQARISRRK